MRAPPEGLRSPSESTAPVILYTTPWCGFCRAALGLLDSRGIEHEQVDVQGNAAARQWLMQVTGQSTVPQIFIRGRSVGGYTELAALDRDGELANAVNPSGD
ncbi:MAG: glutaredoxin [Deltaproteobacteria bacterium]|nr:glutaredoxin [Deltaproteobacteria bacterium]